MLSGKLRFSVFVVVSTAFFSLHVSAAHLVIEDAWIKLAPPGMASHAAYMRLINNDKKPLVITRISATHYAQVMVHQTKIVNDKVQMDHLENLEIPLKSSLTLAPGATHLMLMKPQQPQKIDDQITIHLTFSDGTQQEVVALVRSSHE